MLPCCWLVRSVSCGPEPLDAQGYGVMGMLHGASEEVEGLPAVSLALASLPGVSLRTFHVPPSALPDAGGRACMGWWQQGPHVAGWLDTVLAHARDVGKKSRCVWEGRLALAWWGLRLGGRSRHARPKQNCFACMPPEAAA